MDKHMLDTLKLIGLTDLEIKLFWACFKIGPAPINEVIKEAHLQRSTAYLLVQGLIEKGLILENYSSYKKEINTVEPEKLIKILANKQRILKRQELELQEKLPELQAIYQASEFRPKVRVFQGKQGLLSVWEDILSAKEQILVWTNQETESQFFSPLFHQKFIEERIKKGLKAKVLAVDNKLGRSMIPTDQKALRETRWLPKDQEFSAETYIYDNKVAMLDYNKDIIGIILDSEPFTSAQKTIFELTWDNLIN